MIKKILTSFILVTPLLMADLSIKGIKNMKDESISLKQKNSLSIKESLEENSKFIKGSGKSDFELIINSKKSKIEHIVIYSKYGTLKFKEDFHKFYKSLYDLRLKKIDTNESIIKIRVNIEKQNTEKINVSIFKDSMINPYERYLTYLQKEKGYSKKKIRELLDSDKRKVSKVLLMALYYDYLKNDLTSAKLQYELIIENKLERFVKSEEGIFLADYLTRIGGREKLILKMFPRYTCDLFKEPYKNECKYYRAKALYNIGDKDYIIPLNQIKDLLIPANRLYKQIKKEGGII